MNDGVFEPKEHRARRRVVWRGACFTLCTRTSCAARAALHAYAVCRTHAHARALYCTPRTCCTTLSLLPQRAYTRTPALTSHCAYLFAPRNAPWRGFRAAHRCCVAAYNGVASRSEDRKYLENMAAWRSSQPGVASATESGESHESQHISQPADEAPQWHRKRGGRIRVFSSAFGAHRCRLNESVALAARGGGSKNAYAFLRRAAARGGIEAASKTE